MYFENVRIGISDVDASEKLTIAAMVDFFQDVCTHQADDLGIGADFLRRRGLFWVLTNWQIVVLKELHEGDRIEVHTRPYEIKGFLGMRNFYIVDETGEIAVKANSIWSLLSVERMRPVSVPEELKQYYECGDKLEMEYAPRKMRLPDAASATNAENAANADAVSNAANADGASDATNAANGALGVDVIRVMPYHIDRNRHVNNGQYVRFALSLLPEGFTPSEMRAEYRKQAVVGDEIHPSVYKTDTGYIVAMRDGDGNVYSAVEFLA